MPERPSSEFAERAPLPLRGKRLGKDPQIRSNPPTVGDVAREAGVSQATAARALGDYGSVSAQARARVEAAAKRVGYQVNSLARSMVTGSTNTIGVLLADIENPFFSRVLRGVTDEMRRHGYEVIITNTDEDHEQERGAIRVLTERRVDGLIVCPTDVASRATLTAAIDGGVPLVTVDRRVPGVKADSVGIDNVAAGRKATELLLAAGHTRIAILSGLGPDLIGLLHGTGRAADRLLSATTSGARAEGYRQSLRAAGVTLDPDYLVAAGFHREDAAEATMALLELPEPPTAIVAFDSVQALGALQAMGRRGVRWPDEISILGFDDAEWAPVLNPGLTVVEQPVYQIGTDAAAMLVERLDGRTGRAVHKRLPTTLIERGSVAAPPS